jgi:selenocysteine lyase/cysteine desulfurase
MNEKDLEKLNADQWGVYQQIVQLLAELPDTSKNILKVEYLTAPDPAAEFAAVTVTFPEATVLDKYAKAAIVYASMHCAKIYVTAVSSKIRVSFAFDNIWVK